MKRRRKMLSCMNNGRKAVSFYSYSSSEADAISFETLAFAKANWFPRGSFIFAAIKSAMVPHIKTVRCRNFCEKIIKYDTSPEIFMTAVLARVNPKKGFEVRENYGLYAKGIPK